MAVLTVTFPTLPRLRRPALVGSGALSSRGFRLLWLGQLISFTGSWLQAVAQAGLVLTLTDSALALGLLTVAQFAPMLLLTLPAGVLADRMPKRQIVLAAQAVMLTQAVVLAALVSFGRLELPLLYVLAAVLGCASAIEMPARQAMVAELVPADHLGGAVALNHTAATLAQVIGPLLGGLAAQRLGPAACFWLNAGSFVAMLTSLALMRPAGTHSATPARTGATLGAELRAGLGHARRTPEIVLALMLTGVLGTFGYIFSLVLPLVARDLLDAGPAATGLLMATIGVGSLVAALGLSGRALGTTRLVVAGAGGFSLLLLATARIPGWWTTLPLLAAAGVFNTLFLTASVTSIQGSTPAELRGRVMSLMTLLSFGAKPAGALVVGMLANRFGVQTALTVAALLCGTGTLAGLLYLTAARRGVRTRQEARRVMLRAAGASA